MTRKPTQPHPGQAKRLPEHLARLLKICEGRDFTSRRDTAVILLLVDTGMRRAECVGMTVDDVDLDQRIVWVLGKGRRPRALPIGRKTAQALDRYLRVREGRRLAHLPQVWVGRNGPMTPSGIYQVVHDRARAAGLPAMHPHQLRHEPCLRVGARRLGRWLCGWRCWDAWRRAHPYQLNAGNRCAERRFPRSRSTVEAKVKCSNSLKLSALPHPRTGLTFRRSFWPPALRSPSSQPSTCAYAPHHATSVPSITPRSPFPTSLTQHLSPFRSPIALPSYHSNPTHDSSAPRRR